jgi:hypothetical protein
MMGALLAMIPGKDLLYGAILVVLLAGFGWYTVHERNLGAAHEVAALKSSSDKLQAQTAAQTVELKARANMAEQAYAKEHLSISNLPALQPVRLCNGSANSDRVVPKAARANAGNASTGTAPVGLQPVPSGDPGVTGPDISGMLSALAQSADQVSATLREFQGRQRFDSHD